jgi:hypothetical protein
MSSVMSYRNRLAGRGRSLCMLKGADAMLAAEVRLIGGQGRNVTKKSKASHLMTRIGQRLLFWLQTARNSEIAGKKMSLTMSC